jgi:hypothetical protein
MSAWTREERLIIIRPWARWTAATLAGAGLALTGCGAHVEQAPPPAPAQVVWGGSGEAEPAAAAPSAPASEGAEAAAPVTPEPSKPPSSTPSAPSKPIPNEAESDSSGAIDLDALAASKVAPGAAAPGDRGDGATSGDAQRVLDAAKDRVAAHDAAEAGAGSNGKGKGKAKKGAAKKRSAGARSSGGSKGGAASEPSKPSEPTEGASAPAAAAYSGSDPCKTQRFSVPQVREACASGGRRAAKNVMKNAIQRATAGGGSLRCTSCHDNQVDYRLKPDAVAQLRRWLDS